jgi:hypothetical protein
MLRVALHCLTLTGTATLETGNGESHVVCVTEVTIGRI